MEPVDKRVRVDTLQQHVSALNNRLDTLYDVLLQRTANNGAVVTHNTTDNVNHSHACEQDLSMCQRGGGGAGVCSDAVVQPTTLVAVSIQRLVREGGRVGDYVISPRHRFNSTVVTRTLNFRDAPTTDMASYVQHLYNTFNDIIEFGKTLGG